MAHTYLGEEVLNKYVEDLKDYGIMEKKPNMEGKSMSIVISPIKKK